MRSNAWALVLSLLMPVAMAQSTAPSATEQQLRQQVNALAVAGRHQQALALTEAALQQAERNAVSGGRQAQLALLEELGVCAQLHLRAGDEARALALFARALAMYQQADGILGLAPLPALVPQVDRLASKLNQHELIVQLLEPLLAYPGMEAPRAWPLRLDILGRLGRAALHAGDAAKAEGVLMRALDERKMAAGVILNTPILVASGAYVQGDLTTLRNVQQRMLETLQMVGLSHQASHSDGRPTRDHAVRHGWQDADTPAANLVRLHGGQPAQLSRFYEGAFADYARTMQQTPQVEGYVELEHEYALFGAYLSAAGHWQQAAGAIGEALRLNGLRLLAQTAYLTPDQMVVAVAARRDLVHLLLSHQMAAGTLAAQGRAASGELLQTRTLISHLQSARAAALRHATGPAASLLAAMNELDPNATLRDYYLYSNYDVQLHSLLAAAMAPLQLSSGEQVLSRVQQALGDETLLAFDVFQPFDFASMTRLPARYLGQRITAQGWRLVDLGPASMLDRALSAWRSELLAPPASADSVLSGSAALYRGLLQPLLGVHAADASYVVLADGALLQLPFEAVSDDTGQYLLARGPWRYLSSVRQLMAPPGVARAEGAAVVLGAPDFAAGVAQAGRADAGTAPMRPALQQLQFRSLPGAAAEAQAVAALLRGAGQQVQLRTGSDATTQYLRSVRSPRYVHLATHGYFLGEAAGGSEQVTGQDGQQYLHEMQMPHFNSGLALAGANAVSAAGHRAGLLSAFQLSQLYLEGTELVVLSACETGLATLVSGETIDSLRLSLEAAGARSTVTTLWPVSDAASAELMPHFYASLVAGADKAQALRQAKLALAPAWRHPYYWAPYILGGAR